MRQGPLLRTYRSPLLIGAALCVSGAFHLTLLWFSGADWSGPLSLRKPGLFGLSAGVTVWSIAWVLTQIAPHPQDQRFACLMSGGLFLEVGLITLQHWRGVASHFNRATTLDALIEASMLGLILLVTAGVAWLWWRSRGSSAMPESRAIAIRTGLWLLMVSCGLGLVVTLAGEFNLAHGRSPDIWGRAGVLKYPHGAALHAIQLLPLLSLLLQKFRAPRSATLIRLAAASQVLFLAQAIWQTIQGRTRTDFDAISLVILATAAVLFLLPIAAVLQGVAVMLFCGFRRRSGEAAAES